MANVTRFVREGAETSSDLGLSDVKVLAFHFVAPIPQISSCLSGCRFISANWDNGPHFSPPTQPMELLVFLPGSPPLQGLDAPLARDSGSEAVPSHQVSTVLDLLLCLLAFCSLPAFLLSASVCLPWCLTRVHSNQVLAEGQHCVCPLPLPHLSSPALTWVLCLATAATLSSFRQEHDQYCPGDTGTSRQGWELVPTATYHQWASSPHIPSRSMLLTM